MGKGNRLDTPKEFKQLWYAINNIKRNVHSTFQKEVSSDRNLGPNDIIVPFGNDIGKKVILSPDGSNRDVNLFNVGQVGDTIIVSGNGDHPSSTLKVWGNGATLFGIVNVYEGISVTGDEEAVIRKVGDNAYKITGTFTPISSNLYVTANALSVINEANASTGVTINNPADGSITVETSDPHTGDYFLRATANGNDADWALTIQVPGLETGKQYNVSIRARQPVGSGGGLYFSSGFTESGLISNLPSNSSTWVEYTFVGTAAGTTGSFGTYDSSNVAGNQIDLDTLIVTEA